MATVQSGFVGGAQVALTKPGTNLATPPALLIATTDGEGNLVGQSASFGAQTLITFVAGAQAVTNTGISFSTADLSYLAWDVTVTSITGGTTPTIQFKIDRFGADGVWYNVMATQSFPASGPNVNTADIGPGFSSSFSPPNGVQHAVLTSLARVSWTSTGAPTSANFNMSIIGRP